MAPSSTLSENRRIQSSPNTGRRIGGGPLHAYFGPRRPLADVSGLNCVASSTPEDRGTCAEPEDDEPRRKRPRTLNYQRSSLEAPPLQSASSEDAEDQEDEPRSFPYSLRGGVMNFSTRLLFRSMGMNTRLSRSHCGDWKTEVCKFYSRPADCHEVVQADRTHSLPFTVRASNKSSIVAVGDEHGWVRMLDASINAKTPFTTPISSMGCHDNAVFDISWSRDDSQIITASGDQSLRLFDVSTGTMLSAFGGHRCSVKQVNHHPTMPYLFTSCARDGDIRIWDIRVRAKSVGVGSVPIIGSQITIKDAHTNSSRRGKYSPVSVTAAVWLHNDDYALASACEANAAIKYWDTRCIDKNKKIKPLAQSSLPPHHALRSQRSFGMNSITLSPCGKFLYALCRDSIVYAYATSHIEQGPTHAYTHPRLHASTFYVKTSINRTGSILSVGSSDGVPILFPTDKIFLDKRWHPHTTPTQKSTIDSTTTSSSQLPSSSQPSSSQPQSTKPTPAQLISEHIPVGSGMPLVRGHQKEVTDMSWTKDGDLVTLSDCFTARVWRGKNNGRKVEELRFAQTDAERYMWGWASEDGSDALIGSGGGREGGEE